MRPGPGCPQRVIACVVSAIEPPAFADLIAIAVLRQGDLAHRITAAGMAGENNLSDTRSLRSSCVWTVSLEGGKHLIEIPIEHSRPGQLARLGLRSERRRHQNYTPPALIDPFT